MYLFYNKILYFSSVKKFSIGDKVQLINQNLKGVVLEVFDYKVLIKDEFGFDEEILISNLTFQSNIEDYENFLNGINVVFEKKENNKPEKLSKGNVVKQVLEIDLHIHQLTSSTRHMTNHDMILLKLKKVNETIRLTNKNKYSKIVFIHGIGTGKLRSELEKELRKLKMQYQDASFEKYGGGALEVLLF